MRTENADFVTEFDGNNLYASTDAWSAPVAAEVGPDGAVWFCDWYNIIIQHNPTPTRQRGGYDAETGITAMMRTTGFSLATTGGLQAEGAIPPGVWTPDEVVPAERYVTALALRGVDIRFEEVVP